MVSLSFKGRKSRLRVPSDAKKGFQIRVEGACSELVVHKRRIHKEEKAKVVAAVLGMFLNAARMNEEKFLEEHPFWEGVGLVWCKLEDHLIVPRHPFCQVSIFLFIHFLKSFWR